MDPIKNESSETTHSALCPCSACEDRLERMREDAEAQAWLEAQPGFEG